MLRDEIALFTKLSGRDGEHTPIGVIGAYLDGYEKGCEDAKAKYERPHGKWIFDTDSDDNYAWFRCSECNATKKMDINNMSSKFCWKCGADMREVDNV